MKRVAVIAVHGVADQRAGDTARTIASLLANLDGADGSPIYPSFVEETMQVPVRKLPVPDSAGLGETTFAQRAASLRTVNRSTGEPVDVHLEFISTLLAGYEPAGPDDTYETTRHRAVRRATSADGAAPGSPEITVDVFEMYWADLSRLSASALRIFAEIYQLLFHFASLGVHTIRTAQVKEADEAASSTWDRWGTAQRRAGDALALGMLLPNLFFAGLLAVLAISSLPRLTTFNPRIVGLAVFAVVASLIGWVVRRYETLRPGAVQWGLLLAAPLVCVFLVTLLWPGLSDPEPPLQSAVLRSGEVTYLILGGAWIWLLVNGWKAFWHGHQILASPGADPDKIRRVRWTARLSIALPAALFSITTTLLWSAVWSATSMTFPNVPKAMHPQFILGVLLKFHDVPVGVFVDQLITHAAGLGFAITLLLIGLAAVIALVVILPAARREVWPPAEGADGTRLGNWLTRGFTDLRWAGRLLFLAVMVVLPLGVAFLVLGELGAISRPWLDTLLMRTRTIFNVSASLLISGAVGIFAFKDRLKSLVLRLRGIVDVLLDVDNYLREHPRSRTPRARIYARYASLLRAVAADGYDTVVIVAHSQGSVISADLLRYVATQQVHTGTYLAQADLAGLRRSSVRLFTMGCPLRQLYGLRFPHLYEWARHTVPGPCDDPADTIDRGTAPDPATLGLDCWVNAYRSGDYVGRQLWRPDRGRILFASSPARPTQPWMVGPFPVTASECATPPATNRREFCIGSGAHTHYWDATAPQIALELDDLIVR